MANTNVRNIFDYLNYGDISNGEKFQDFAAQLLGLKGNLLKIDVDDVFGNCDSTFMASFWFKIGLEAAKRFKHAEEMAEIASKIATSTFEIISKQVPKDCLKKAMEDSKYYLEHLHEIELATKAMEMETDFNEKAKIYREKITELDMIRCSVLGMLERMGEKDKVKQIMDIKVES